MIGPIFTALAFASLALAFGFWAFVLNERGPRSAKAVWLLIGAIVLGAALFGWSIG